MADAAVVIRDYFAALGRRDADAMAGLWAPGGVDHIAGQGDAVGPAGVREHFTALLAAGIAAMTVAVPRAAAPLGGINRAVLGHLDPLTGDVRARLERAVA